jgi:hypothetical protein
MFKKLVTDPHPQKQMNPVHILKPHFLKVYFNITLLSMFCSPTGLFSSGFLTKIGSMPAVCTILFSLDCFNDIW